MIDFNEVVDPKWEEFDKEFKHVHDWRNYIPDSVRGIWQRLSIETRIVVIECLQGVADNEHWD